MPLPVAAAGAAVARKAALSTARRPRESRIVNSPGAKVTKRASGRKESKRDKISWFEVIFVGGFVFLVNDLPDIANVAILPQIITGPIDILTTPVVAVWFWLRVGEKPVRSGANNVFKMLIELIPIVGIVPTWTLSIINVKLRWFDFFFHLPAKMLKIVGL